MSPTFFGGGRGGEGWVVVWCGVVWVGEVGRGEWVGSLLYCMST